MSHVRIEVVSTEQVWGCRPEDIQAVCLSVAKCFEPAVQERTLDPIRVEPGDVKSVPITLFERSPSGQHRIQLPARGRQWAQFAYQFAHELCHTLANARIHIHRPTQWIEESLCEMTSLIALSEMARMWEHNPPYLNWASYSTSLQAYFENRLAEQEHQIPLEGFTEWLQRIRPELERDPYRRSDNTIIGRWLLAIFDHDPQTFRAIRYLNLWEMNKDNAPFEEFFELWRSVAPPKHHQVITRTEDRLTRGIL